MKELVEAYSVLIDPVKRKAYDKQPTFQVRKFRKPTRAPKTAAPAPTEKPGCLARLLAWARFS